MRFFFLLSSCNTDVRDLVSPEIVLEDEGTLGREPEILFDPNLSLSVELSTGIDRFHFSPGFVDPEDVFWDYSYVLADKHKLQGKSVYESLVIIPVVENNDLSAALIYSFEFGNTSPNLIAKIDLSDQMNYAIKYGLLFHFGVSELKNAFYVVGDVDFEISIEPSNAFSSEDEVATQSKSCEVIVIQTINCYRLGPNGEYGENLGCFVVDNQFINCFNDDIYVPRSANPSLNFFRSNGNGTRNDEETEPSLEGNILRHYPSCRTWHFNARVATRIGRASQAVDRCRFSLVGYDNNRGGPIVRNIAYNLEVHIPLELSADVESSEFRSCVNIAFAAALEQVHLEVGTPPTGSNALPPGLMQRPGALLADQNSWIVPEENIIDRIGELFTENLNSPWLSCGRLRDRFGVRRDLSIVIPRSGLIYQGGELNRGPLLVTDDLFEDCDD